MLPSSRNVELRCKEIEGKCSSGVVYKTIGEQGAALT
jgi:hypothetical protein